MEAFGIGLIAFLVLFPMLTALVQLVVRNDKVRTYLTVLAALVIAVASVFCAIEFAGAGATTFALDESTVRYVSWATLAVDAVLCLYVIGKGVVHRKWLAVLLAAIQLCLAVYLDLGVMDGVAVAAALSIDRLSIVMCLIIGIVGSGICVYALGYMRVHEAHTEGPDRRNVFFALMFAFLGAMNAIVFSNDLTWLLCAWEFTTVCSFALIGYTRTREAIDNSFLQIVLNLVGGIAFTCALIWTGIFIGVNEFDQFLSVCAELTDAGYETIVMVPVLLLALAAFAKAAQLPFQSWLLGAMVAPTPTSALLHSSTMVKAGVFLLIKLAPLFGANVCGYVVMFVGGATFLVAALAAISQSNAKRVLAWSTISNLGLITACAGIGSDGAIWAAIFLVIFHAVAKSLLFLCVGTAEHHIGSRDIESMDGLFCRMPRLARFMAIGIFGMFVAPFGMLVSKWAALQAFAGSENVVLILLLVFGSAATFVFWAKWLGKILAIANTDADDVELTVSASEWASLGLMTILTVGCCIFFPLISQSVVVPYLAEVFGEVTAAISSGDLWIMAFIACILACILLGFTGGTTKKVVPVYMAGASIDSEQRSFRNSFGKEEIASQRNWYMEGLFGEKKMAALGVCAALVVCCGAGAWCAQAAADEKDSIGYTAQAVASYPESPWAASDDVSYSEYISTYAYYAADFEAYEEDYESYYGVTSVDELMDLVFEYYYGTDDDTDDTEDTDDTDDTGDTEDTDDTDDATGADDGEEGE